MTILFRTTLICGTLVAVVAIAGCQRGQPVGTSHPAATIAPAAGAAKSSPRAAPDFGGVTKKHVEVTATGPTLQAAVDNAIRLAIEQVNGERVDAMSAKLDAGASLQSGDNQLSIGSKAYADFVRSATSGAVANFQILSQKQTNVPASSDKESLKASTGASWSRGNVDATAGASAEGGGATARVAQSQHGQWDEQQGATSTDYSDKHTEFATVWEVRIAADVAAYRESAAAKLTRVVVAQPQVDSTSYRVGDNLVPSAAITSTIQAKVSEALTQTHRFTVLDRNSDPLIDAELQRIQSGNDTPADSARLGQQLATDLIVIPTINRFEYIRHERPLRLADRTLVSYSGGAEVSFRVVSAVTGQIVMSKSFDYTFPATSPTTLGISVDGDQLAIQMMNSVDRDIIAAILQSTYPLSVLEVQGQNVIINQGGDAVRSGATYQAVFLGKPIVDPQSGQTLGPAETPCCSVEIDRVTPHLSYGHFTQAGLRIPSPFKPGSIELRDQTVSATPTVEAQPRAAARRMAAKAHSRPSKPPKGDDANW